MEARQIETIAHLGGALWSDPSKALKASQEALVAAILLDLPSEEQTFNRVSRAMLDRAIRVPAAVDSFALNHPFYRLFPEERLVLIALHQARWSYRRIASILEETTDHLQEIAWNARLFMANSHIQSVTGKPLPHPTGSSKCTNTCPEFNPKKPWTQKFLDDEMNHQERVYIQGQLKKCAGCSDILNRCREIYYAVEASIPTYNSPDTADHKKILEHTFERSEQYIHPWKMTFTQSIKVYLQKRDVQLAIFLLTLLVITL